MKKVDIVLYTMNRACQADLALRSIKDLFPNVGKVVVFYRYSTPEFKAGYDKLFSKDYGLDIDRKYQNNFKKDFEGILNNLKSPFFLGMCDDDVFVKKTNCDEILNKLYEEEVAVISLRAGLNITKNYPNFNIIQPKFIETNPFLKWEWKLCDPWRDWGYPTCVNAFIYLKEYFMDLIEPVSFAGVNSMEGKLASHRNRLKKYIIGFKESKILNVAVNIVQTEYETNSHELKYSHKAEDLNKKYLDGYIISTENIYNYPMNMGVDEIKYKFKKEK